MEFEVGKLYKCSEYFLIIYPTRENAMSAMASLTRILPASRAVFCSALAAWCAPARARRAAAQAASYWSKELNCTVRYSEPDEIFIFLKEEIIEEQKYINVLFGDKQGWIIYEDWMEIERSIQ